MTIKKKYQTLFSCELCDIVWPSPIIEETLEAIFEMNKKVSCPECTACAHHEDQNLHIAPIVMTICQKDSNGNTIQVVHKDDTTSIIRQFESRLKKFKAIPIEEIEAYSLIYLRDGCIRIDLGSKKDHPDPERAEELEHMELLNLLVSGVATILLEIDLKDPNEQQYYENIERFTEEVEGFYYMMGKPAGLKYCKSTEDLDPQAPQPQHED